MKWFDLIFSVQPSRLYIRHVIFWMAWLFYFAFSFFFIQQGLNNTGNVNGVLIILPKACLLVLGHVFMVYTFIYFLVPLFVLNNRYFYFILGSFSACIINISWSLFCYSILFPPLNVKFHFSPAIAKNTLLWSSVYAGLISSLKVVAAAAAIKLLKRWYLKQAENDQLEKEKLSIEIQLLKAQIHPDVLFSSLDNIYSFAQKDSVKASALLLKLSDLLSYVLYESENDEVPLEKEIKMLKDYITLEKARLDNQLEISFVVKGDVAGKMIAPLILLPFVENSFFYCSNDNLEKAWINLEIKIEGNHLSMKLINGKSADKEISTASNTNGLANVYKRVHLLYADRNEIRIHAEPEIMMTFLKIQLDHLSKGEYINKDEAKPTTILYDTE